jgi:hypothetical protein
MSYSPMNAAVAREHARELQSAAAQRRLARIATCCKPSYLAARFAELRERLAHRSAAAACCS